MKQDKVILGYWAIRGLGERCRMLLEYTGVPYEEVKYCPKKPEKWFDEDRIKFSKKNPAANLPYILDGEKVVAESDAVMIYIAQKSGKVELLGRNSEEQLSIATTLGVFKDLHRMYLSLSYGKYNYKTFEEAKAENIKEFKKFLTKLNGLLEGRDFYAGLITWIDFAIAEVEQCLWLLDNNLIESFPNVWNHQKRIWNLPAIKAYHSTNRWSERPINDPYSAKFF